MVVQARARTQAPTRDCALWRSFLQSLLTPARRSLLRACCAAQVATCAFLGVGTPEVLVIGVVALIVFGPKGLADVAKQLGGIVRAFQPTLRELQDISQDFKQTIDDEIGLDELKKDLDTIRQPLTELQDTINAPLASPAPRKTAAEAPAPAAATPAPEAAAAAAAVPEASAAEASTAAAEPAVPMAAEGDAAAAPAGQDTVTQEMIEASKQAAWGEEAPAVAPVAEAEAPAAAAAATTAEALAEAAEAPAAAAPEKNE